MLRLPTHRTGGEQGLHHPGGIRGPVHGFGQRERPQLRDGGLTGGALFSFFAILTGVDALQRVHTIAVIFNAAIYDALLAPLLFALVALMRVRSVLVVVNKMDLVQWDRARFDAIRGDVIKYASQLGLAEVIVVPVSAADGGNVVRDAPDAPWYKGCTVLQALETLPGRRHQGPGLRPLCQARWPAPGKPRGSHREFASHAPSQPFGTRRGLAAERGPRPRNCPKAKRRYIFHRVTTVPCV